MSKFALKLSPVALFSLSITTGSMADSCDEVYLSNIRNYSNDESSYASLHVIFDDYCSASGELKSEKASANLETIIKAVPVKFSGDKGSASERFSNFCRNYTNIRFSSQWQNIKLNTVSVEALKQYNVCRSIQDSYGVTISHNFVQPNGVIVNFSFANAKTAFQYGPVITSKDTVCESNSVGVNRKAVRLSSRSYEVRGDFSITCNREGKKAKDGSVSYSPSSIGIATNFGSYVIPMQADTIYNNELASDATNKISNANNQISALTGERDKLAQQNAALNGRINGLRLDVHKIMIGQYHPGGGDFSFHGCGTDPNMIANNLCPSPARISVRHAFQRGGEQCGYNTYVISCVYLGQ